MLTRIRNASKAGHAEVFIPMSKLKMQMAKLIRKKNFVSGVEEISSEEKRTLKISLKYLEDEKGKKSPYIQGLRRVSRQGQRIYAKKDHIPHVKNGYGFAIISTSRGLMTDGESRRAGLGGEIICEIW